MTREPARRPLDGRTVIDLTTALAGPYATLLLAGLGARVIKIENPKGGEQSRTNSPYLGRDGVKLARTEDTDVSLAHLNRSRGKQAITLNLKHASARDIFADLVRNADLVVENFSSGTIDRLGIGYEFGSAVNPRIVYCSISGFGADGDARGKAMDTIVQALSGLMMTSGEPDQPPIRVGIPLGDLIAPLFGVIGSLAALDEATRTGHGQRVDVSMLGALTSLVASETFDAVERLGNPIRSGRMVPRLALFGIYQTRDGWLSICAPLDKDAENVLHVIGRADLFEDERFATRDARVRNQQELNRLVEDWTRTRCSAEVIQRLQAVDVPVGEVRSPLDAMRDPHVLRREETQPLVHPQFEHADDIRGMGLPIRFSRSPNALSSSAPGLGEHNDIVYGGLLGYPTERLNELRAQGVI
jgi:CoA:oxalate CoA-transferase